jgi:hypothetical protein
MTLGSALRRPDILRNGGSLAAPLSCHAGGREFESRRPRSKKQGVTRIA